MFLNRILKTIKPFKNTIVSSPYQYKPSPYLMHHTLQSAFQVLSPKINCQFQREKIFFADGGHICLDWVNKIGEQDILDKPVLLVMHGMTGGSDSKYIQTIAQIAQDKGYTCLCLNSRGFNSIMTSPVPFIGLQFHQLQATLLRIKTYYPNRSLHMIGMSLGGNYLLRYLLKNNNNNQLLSNLKSLVLVCPPFDIKYVIYNMNMGYQKLFLQFYFKYLVSKHQQMDYWWKSGVIDIQHLQKSKNLIEFHSRITQKIVGEPIDRFFDRFKVQSNEIQTFPVDTLIISSKDDPMINIQSIPVDSIRRNKNIKFILTDAGAHMCWFEGLIPSRWYPRPVFQFIEDIQNNKNKKTHEI